MNTIIQKQVLLNNGHGATIAEKRGSLPTAIANM